jgi:hypothetical protein
VTAVAAIDAEIAVQSQNRAVRLVLGHRPRSRRPGENRARGGRRARESVSFAHPWWGSLLRSKATIGPVSSTKRFTSSPSVA